MCSPENQLHTNQKRKREHGRVKKIRKDQRREREERKEEVREDEYVPGVLGHLSSGSPIFPALPACNLPQYLQKKEEEEEIKGKKIVIRIRKRHMHTFVGHRVIRCFDMIASEVLLRFGDWRAPA